MTVLIFGVPPRRKSRRLSLTRQFGNCQWYRRKFEGMCRRLAFDKPDYFASELMMYGVDSARERRPGK